MEQIPIEQQRLVQSNAGEKRDSGVQPTTKYPKVLEQVIRRTSTNRCFRTNNMLLPHMSKQKRDCHTFILREKLSKREYTLVPSI